MDLLAGIVVLTTLYLCFTDKIDTDNWLIHFLCAPCIGAAVWLYAVYHLNEHPYIAIVWALIWALISAIYWVAKQAFVILVRHDFEKESE